MLYDYFFYLPEYRSKKYLLIISTFLFSSSLVLSLYIFFIFKAIIGFMNKNKLITNINDTVSIFLIFQFYMLLLLLFLKSYKIITF